MASTDAIPVPRKNTAYRFYFAIRKPSDSTLITTWAGQDSEVSLDGAAFSDCTNEATEIGTSGCGYIDLTSSEMNADNVLLKVTVTNTGAVPLVFALYPESAGDYRCDVQLWNSVSLGTTNPLPNAAPAAVGGLITAPTTANVAYADVKRLHGTSWVVPDVAGTPDVSVKDIHTAAITSIWDALTSGMATAGSIGKRIIDYLTGDVFARVGAPAGASIAADIAAVKVDTAAALVDTNELQTDWANGGRLDLILDIIAADTTTDIPASINALTRFFKIASGTIGTDNNTTQLHLPGLTFGDDELNNLLVIVYDVSEDEYHSNWINAWSAAGENVASLVLTLPFTPQASVDTYVVLSLRSNNKQLTALQTAVDTVDDLLDTEVAALTTQLGLVKDRVSYCLTVLVGACSDAGTSAETYVYTIGGETFTADYTGLDATGNRTTTTLSKV